MTNSIILYSYYYKYREHRKQIKNLVQSNSFTEGRNKIDAVIAEHDNYVNSRGIQNNGNNFTSLDNLSLKHASDHLEFAPVYEEQKQATIDALDEEYY